MHFPGEDLFVGGIAIVLGMVVLYSSLAQQSWFFNMRKVRWLETKLGRASARWVCIGLATALIFFGSAIAMGYSLDRLVSGESDSNRDRNGKAQLAMPLHCS